MIFISSRKSGFNERYTIYHEHLEGNCWLELDRVRMAKHLEKAANHLIQDIPDLAERIAKSLDQKEDRVQHAFHLYALIAELSLAKKELSPGLFSKHLETALRDRF